MFAIKTYSKDRSVFLGHKLLRFETNCCVVEIIHSLHVFNIFDKMYSNFYHKTTHSKLTHFDNINFIITNIFNNIDTEHFR